MWWCAKAPPNKELPSCPWASNPPPLSHPQWLINPFPVTWPMDMVVNNDHMTHLYNCGRYNSSSTSQSHDQTTHQSHDLSKQRTAQIHFLSHDLTDTREQLLGPPPIRHWWCVFEDLNGEFMTDSSGIKSTQIPNRVCSALTDLQLATPTPASATSFSGSKSTAR